MLEEGVASADGIDTAMELGYKHPVGPLRTTDIVCSTYALPSPSTSAARRVAASTPGNAGPNRPGPNVIGT